MGAATAARAGDSRAAVAARPGEPSPSGEADLALLGRIPGQFPVRLRRNWSLAIGLGSDSRGSKAKVSVESQLQGTTERGGAFRQLHTASDIRGEVVEIRQIGGHVAAFCLETLEQLRGGQP